MLQPCRKMLQGRMLSPPTQQGPAVIAPNGMTSQNARSPVMSLFSNAQRLDLSDVRGEGSAPVRTALSGLILESALKDLGNASTSNARPQDSKNASQGSFAHAMTALSGLIGLHVMALALPAKGDARPQDGRSALRRDPAPLMTSQQRIRSPMPLSKKPRARNALLGVSGHRVTAASASVLVSATATLHVFRAEDAHAMTAQIGLIGTSASV
jgi:hypothetical protein